ncbi:uncharacterized protein PG986_001180 [Apiospora aurea]|uniref:F-box domain-containing protein n=1 Tax=Apiospora aurea TaxID=335848 RepID=A0ABR1QWU3_9PEZI
MSHDQDHAWAVVRPPPPGGTAAPPSPTTGTTSSSTERAAPSAAQHQVLHTPELLEAILAGSGDMRAVLLAQRVSVFWRDLIRASSLLQCLLYFEPVPPFAPGEGLAPEELRAAFAINPLLTHCFPQWLRMTTTASDEPGAGLAPRSLATPQRQFPAHPVLSLSLTGLLHFARRDYRQDEDGYDSDSEEETGGGGSGEQGECSGSSSSSNSKLPVVPLFPPERRDAFTRAGASWRRMLVCQPASMGLGLELVRPAAAMPPEWHEMHEAHRRNPMPNPGLRGREMVEAFQEPITSGRISGLLETPLPTEMEGPECEGDGEGDSEGGGLRMGTLYDICLQQLLDNADVRRGRRPSFVRLHWLPPGYGGVFPHHELELRFGPSTPGLGVSVFAVLEDIVHSRGFHFYGRRTKAKHLPREELETFRCEEHLVRKPMSFVTHP